MFRFFLYPHLTIIHPLHQAMRSLRLFPFVLSLRILYTKNLILYIKNLTFFFELYILNNMFVGSLIFSICKKLDRHKICREAMALLSTDRITAPVFMTGGGKISCAELQVISENSRRPPSFWMGFPSWNTEAMTLPESPF